MRHYEIVFMVYPDQSDQVPQMIERYGDIVKRDGGQVHRVEDWGRRQLAYSIDKLHKAHYVLVNVECTSEALDEIQHSFRFNDAVLRNLIIRRDGPITDSSPLIKSAEENEEEDKGHWNQTPDADAPAAAETAETSGDESAEAAETVEEAAEAASESETEPPESESPKAES